MDRAIIICKNPKLTEYFEKFLIDHKIRDITQITNASRARRMIQEQSYQIAIIVAPLVDELGDDVAKEISKLPHTQVIFFAKEELLGDGSGDLSDFGVINQAIPISKRNFELAFRLARAFNKKMMTAISKSADLQTKLQDIKKIDLAKCLLIERENTTEEEAHKQIEKLAMDKRKSKLEIAQQIIAKYKASPKSL